MTKRRSNMTKKAIALMCAISLLSSTMFSSCRTTYAEAAVSAVSDVTGNISEKSEIWDGTSDISWYNSNKKCFEISTAEQLAGLSELVRNGNNMNEKTFRLTKDIVLNDTSNYDNWETQPPENNWIPIGVVPVKSPGKDSSDNSACTVFYGVFDGNGHTIEGMYVNHDCLAGLFAKVGGAVSRTILDKSYVYCNTPTEKENYNAWSAKAGGFAAVSEQGVFNQLEFNGKVIAKRNGIPTARPQQCVAGGIVGDVKDSINFWIVPELFLLATTGYIINPLIFYASEEFSGAQTHGVFNSINHGDIVTDAESGGIIGHGNTGDSLNHSLSVINCYSDGKINGKSYGAIGGNVYKFQIVNCYYDNCNKGYTVGAAGSMDIAETTNLQESGMTKQEAAEKLGKLFACRDDQLVLNFDPDVELPEYDENYSEGIEELPAEQPEEEIKLDPPVMLKPNWFGFSRDTFQVAVKGPENAECYELQIANTNNFRDLTFKCTYNLQYKCAISNLVKDRIYYVRVRVYSKENNKKVYSNWKVFTMVSDGERITISDNVSEDNYTMPENQVKPETGEKDSEQTSNGSTETPAIKADINGDGVVNMFDFVTLKEILLSENTSKSADVNSDGVVNILDLILVKSILMN